MGGQDSYFTKIGVRDEYLYEDYDDLHKKRELSKRREFHLYDFLANCLGAGIQKASLNEAKLSMKQNLVESIDEVVKRGHL